MKKRTLKVKEKHTPRDYDRRRVVPTITLSGVWLEQAGFSIEDMVEVEVREKELQIKIKPV